IIRRQTSRGALDQADAPSPRFGMEQGPGCGVIGMYSGPPPPPSEIEFVTAYGAFLHPRARGSRNLPENCATGSPACLARRGRVLSRLRAECLELVSRLIKQEPE